MYAVELSSRKPSGAGCSDDRCAVRLPHCGEQKAAAGRDHDVGIFAQLTWQVGSVRAVFAGDGQDAGVDPLGVWRNDCCRTQGVGAARSRMGTTSAVADVP